MNLDERRRLYTALGEEQVAHLIDSYHFEPDIEASILANHQNVINYAMRVTGSNLRDIFQDATRLDSGYNVPTLQRIIREFHGRQYTLPDEYRLIVNNGLINSAEVGNVDASSYLWHYSSRDGRVAAAYMAAMNGHVDVLEAFFREPNPVFIIDSAVQGAIETGQQEAIDFLLIEAANQGEFELVKTLIENGATTIGRALGSVQHNTDNGRGPNATNEHRRIIRYLSELY